MTLNVLWGCGRGLCECARTEKLLMRTQTPRLVTAVAQTACRSLLLEFQGPTFSMFSALCCSFLCFQKLMPSPAGTPKRAAHSAASPHRGGKISIHSRQPSAHSAASA